MQRGPLARATNFDGTGGEAAGPIACYTGAEGFAERTICVHPDLNGDRRLTVKAPAGDSDLPGVRIGGGQYLCRVRASEPNQIY